jgi:hypothetical protein
MGIMDVFKGKKNNDPTDRTVLVLTPLGKSKAEKFDLPGIKWRVLAMLSETGPCTVHEISTEMGIDEQKAKAVAISLINEGYIRKAATTE